MHLINSEGAWRMQKLIPAALGEWTHGRAGFGGEPRKTSFCRIENVLKCNLLATTCLSYQAALLMWLERARDAQFMLLQRAEWACTSLAKAQNSLDPAMANELINSPRPKCRMLN